MKMKSIVTVLVASAVFFSCIKTNNVVGPNDITGNGTPGGGGSVGGGGIAVGNLLVKAVSKEGTDSVVTTYTYDGSNRLIKQKMLGKSGGQNINIVYNYTRNASGIITQTTEISLDALGGFDTSVTNYIYNAASGRYSFSFMTATAFGFSYSDSTAYTYDASGKLTSEESFSDVLGSFDPSSKTTYVYNAAGDIASLKQYDHNGTSYDEIANDQFTYDDKINPIIASPTDAIVRGFAGGSYSHNVTRIAVTSIPTPAANTTVTIAYTYSSNNKPVSAVQTTTPGGISNLSFYYQ
jgi:hypothetical protein